MLILSDTKERYDMWILYLLGVAIALVIDYVVARKFADIAEISQRLARIPQVLDRN